ncbi:hypothetical protein [Arthrobacter burdickii]|uniref:Uncharacterized protein n=1 Tax=Arthrobacter burdickii TaxID=3035920 RepID=A0ABT8K1X9_9MICC|nr:hypothetical protein [Arthrobacter burdickii]MDN4611448.1 hypothetical protein [Arthrobacter burdickii]
MTGEISRGPRRVYQGADVQRSGAVVPRVVRRAEVERAWKADYRVHAGGAITKDAGKNLKGIRNEFQNHIQDDPGAEPGLAYFEGNFIAGAGDIIADYMDGEKP